MKFVLPVVFILLWYPPDLFSQTNESSYLNSESFQEDAKHNKVNLHRKNNQGLKEPRLSVKKINAENMLVEYISQIWSDTGWVNETKQNVYYNERGNWIEILNYLWNNTGWDKYKKYEQKYDVNNNWIEWKKYVWNDTGWVNDVRAEQSYDENNNWIEWIGYTWTNNGWQNY